MCICYYVFVCVWVCVSVVKYVYVLHKNIIEQIIIKFHTLYNEMPYNITVLWRMKNIKKRIEGSSSRSEEWVGVLLYEMVESTISILKREFVQ